MITYCTKFILTLYNIPLHLYLQYTTVFIQYSIVVLCVMFWNVHQSSSFPWQQLKFEMVKSLMYVHPFFEWFYICGPCHLSQKVQLSWATVNQGVCFLTQTLHSLKFLFLTQTKLKFCYTVPVLTASHGLCCFDSVHVV